MRCWEGRLVKKFDRAVFCFFLRFRARHVFVFGFYIDNTCYCHFVSD